MCCVGVVQSLRLQRPDQGYIFIGLPLKKVKLCLSSAAHTTLQGIRTCSDHTVGTPCVEVHLLRMMSLCCFRHHTPFPGQV